MAEVSGLYSAGQEQLAVESQFDFSGGENSVTDKALLRSNESTKLRNVFIRRGGGLTARSGYKAVAAAAAGQGRWITEFEQSAGQVLTYQDVLAAWYDETMQPRYRLFEQTPRLNDAAYLGSRSKFFSVLLNLVYAFVPASATQGLVYEYWNGTAWTDFTSQVTAPTSDDKKLAVAAISLPREIQLSWTDLSGWTPNQVETRTYQYWIRIRVTVDLQNGGSDVVQSQKRLRSDWLGQRKLIVGGNQTMQEFPGLTLTKRLIEANTGVSRLGGVAMNDYLYYHSNGQRPLRRWNGCRGVTRSGFNNSPGDASLAAPAAPTLGQSGTAGYATGVVLRYRVSRTYGPEGILGESLPSPSVEITIAGGPKQVDISIAAIVTAAAAFDVSGLRIYATYDLQGVNAAERDRMERFLLIKVVDRDDATWNAGTFADSNVARIVTGQSTPIPYSNAPTFYPKYVGLGGDRVWIADDHFVSASDIRQGDSYSPDNLFRFPQVNGILWWVDRMLVFQPDRISAIRGINTGLPWVEDFHIGLGNVQPDSIAAGDGYFFFVSKLGPARGNLISGVELLALGRVFESANYWIGTAAERRLAQGAYFNHRYWIPVDGGSRASSCDDSTAVYDLLHRGWTHMRYAGTSASQVPIGALAVVHGTLDHPLANQLVLLGFPDAQNATDKGDLLIMEYGTSDRWTTNAYDGTAITVTIETRALSMGALHRSKAFKRGHVRIKFPFVAAGPMSVSVRADVGASVSQVPTFAGSNALEKYVDCKWEPSAVGASGGPFEENCPVIQFTTTTDLGFDLIAWWLEAEVLDFETGWQV